MLSGQGQLFYGGHLDFFYRFTEGQGLILNLCNYHLNDFAKAVRRIELTEFYKNTQQGSRESICLPPQSCFLQTVF